MFRVFTVLHVARPAWPGIGLKALAKPSENIANNLGRLCTNDMLQGALSERYISTSWNGKTSSKSDVHEKEYTSSYAENKSWNSDSDSNLQVQDHRSFSSLGVGAKLTEKLSSLRISKPVEIQSLALPLVFKYQNVIVQSETGSGKTLAYLLPAIQQARYPCSVMIIVPTRELAYQIYIEARKLTERRNVACFVSRQGIDKEIEQLKLRPPKIIIGTPKLLYQVVMDHEFLFTSIRRVITDEVDKLLPSIPYHNKRLIKKFQQNPKPINKLLAVLQGIAKERVQYIACSATVDQQMINTLKDLGWGHNLKHIKPKSYNHKKRIVPPTISHSYVLVQDDSIDSKVAAVSRILNRTHHKSALVFVHRDHSVHEYVTEMQNFHLNAVAYYQQVLSGATGDIIKFLDDFRTGKISVVVASQEEVRGLDFKDLEQVYLFEVPRNTDEYVHLAGRVGRLGRKGSVTTIVSELDEDNLDRLRNMYRSLEVAGKELIL